MAKKHKRTATSVCRDCGRKAEVQHGARARSPRCIACGGIMDKLTPKPWLRRQPDGSLTSTRK
jgi:hypothetical protein